MKCKPHDEKSTPDGTTPSPLPATARSRMLIQTSRELLADSRHLLSYGKGLMASARKNLGELKEIQARLVGKKPPQP